MKDLFAVVIAAILSLAGAFFGPKIYASLSNNSTATTMIEQMTTGRSTLVTRFANMGVRRFGTAGFSAANVIAWHVLPDEAYDTGTNTLGNPFGGVYQLGGAGRTFTWDADAIPRDGCIASLTSFPPGSGYTTAAVATTLAGLGAATANSLPVSPQTAAGVCSDGDNAIRFVGG